ncbi:pyruvate-flavodoxin oxidoreductase [Cutibacterium acnes JCM 18909]|nr:pyruvate-flavodoxin oxidoreductase [Cutibacterium acnes JCM 18909]
MKFFETIPVNDRSRVDFATVRGTQFLEPLFEFSGACSGCGETPYVKLITQLFGDRAEVANATGCSSIYGGNLPTTPWGKNASGRGPAWSNSLFEDNAEFGLGMRMAANVQTELARRRLQEVSSQLDPEFVEDLLHAPQLTEHDLQSQQHRVKELQTKLANMEQTPAVRDLMSVADHLLRRSVWIIGGDGWAYDIGSGGVDHVLASGRDVNILVLDTEVYSNTGGQASKSTPLGAVAKFASLANPPPKKRHGPASHRLRVGVRRPRGPGRRSAANPAGLPRGRGLPWSEPHHRLQPLHRPRLRPAKRPGPAVQGGPLWTLAADALQPGASRRRAQPIPARLPQTRRDVAGVHQARAALPDAPEGPSGRGRTYAGPGPAPGRASLRRVCRNGIPHRRGLRRRCPYVRVRRFIQPRLTATKE